MRRPFLLALVGVLAWQALPVVVLLLAVVIGVVLPAVWSGKSTRRRAAVRVLRLLLGDSGTEQ
jgi:hypothetical protein